MGVSAMGISDYINIGISVISIVIALSALWQTNQQLKLSNNQQLFDRRLNLYLLFITLLRLYKENKTILTSERKESYIGSHLFVWLTNCSDLEDMADAIDKPLHSKEHKNLLVKCEKLRNASVEASMIFDSEESKNVSDFIKTYSDFLKALYQQQVYLASREKNDQGMPPLLEEYRKDCHQMAEHLELFKLHDRLDELMKEIDAKGIAERLKEKTCLLKHHQWKSL